MKKIFKLKKTKTKQHFIPEAGVVIVPAPKCACEV